MGHHDTRNCELKGHSLSKGENCCFGKTKIAMMKLGSQHSSLEALNFL